MTDPRAPKVLVIILNYRTPQMTLRAAEAALRDMPARKAELVIIDNASGDGSPGVLTREIAERGWDKGGRVRLILSDVNGGFGAGCNIGFAAGMSDGSRPDYFYLLNSDAFPDPGCLGKLIDHLESHPKAGFAGSHVRGEDGLDHTTAFRFPSIAGEFEGAARIGPITRVLRRHVIAPDLPTETARVDWCAGASVLVRAEMLDQIGSFDETFFLYFEETDLCLRAARAGWECWYLPSAHVVHIGSASTGMKAWDRVPAYWYASRRHYFVKNHGRIYAAAALLAKLAGGALHSLRCALTGRPPQDPPGFYRDLLRFGLGLPLERSAPVSRRTVSEENP
ncbi:glycosyltransferase family 2 protein [Marimonas sp. MJW-29]|uniref:Glycosyltransferase family 2 protein n=1 Tax=Sulfitobacter sediminis TaxID=3234186 RepID=A0ABV3RJ07_9RHOB